MSKSSKLISNLSSLKDSPFHLSTSKNQEKQIFYFNLLKKKEYPKGLYFKTDDYHYFKELIDVILNAILINYIPDINERILADFNRIHDDLNLQESEKLHEWKQIIKNLINVNLQFNANELIDKFNKNKRSNVTKERIITITFNGIDQEIKIKELYILLINLLNIGFSNIHLPNNEKHKTNKISAYTNMNIIYKHFYFKLVNHQDNGQYQLEKISKLLKYILARLVIDKISKGETDKELHENHIKYLLSLLKKSNSLKDDTSEYIVKNFVDRAKVYFYN